MSKNIRITNVLDSVALLDISPEFLVPTSENYVRDGTRLNYEKLCHAMSELPEYVKQPTSKENKLEQAIVMMKGLSLCNLESEPLESFLYSTEMDNESRKLSVDSELSKSEFEDYFDGSSSETDLCIQKSTKALDEKESEIFLLEVAKSILESLDSDITTSLKISRKDMYLPKIPGFRSRCNSITSEESGMSPERCSPTSSNKMGTSTGRSSPTSSIKTNTSPSTSPKKTDSPTKENIREGTAQSCFTCLYFDQMDSIYDMQQNLLNIREDLGQFAKELLDECKNFNSDDFDKIQYILDRYDDIVNERRLIEEGFEESKYFRLDAWDAIGAVRLSTQMMYYKYLLLENDKYIQTFQLVQFIMTQLRPSRTCLQKEAV